MGGAAAVPQSLRYLIGDVQRVGGGDPESRGPVPFVVEAPPQQATGDVEAVIRGAVATIRDAAAEEAEGGYEAREPKQMMAMVMEAFHSRARLRIVYADHGGEQVEDVVAVVMCSPAGAPKGLRRKIRSKSSSGGKRHPRSFKSRSFLNFSVSSFV